MNNLGFALDGAWRVLIAGLCLGAGLPVIFALGVRAMAHAEGRDAETAGGTPSATRALVGRALGALCLVLVLSAVALGITFIVASGFGKTLSFEHVYPTLVDHK